MKNKTKIEFDRTRPFILCQSYEEFQNLGMSSRQRDRRNKSIEDVVEVSK